MKWGSALSHKQHTLEALAEAMDALEASLEGGPADLIVLFTSAHHVGWLEEVLQRLAERFPVACRIGCSGGGVIGGGQEVEEGPALSLVGAHLPGVSLTSFHMDQSELPEPIEAGDFWRARLGTEALPGLLLLVDPFTLDPDGLVRGLDVAYPRTPKVGGLASGGLSPGSNRLVSGDEVWRSGAVGVALSGDIRLHTVVAQGCRPIGTPMLVTRCQGNAVFELDGRPPLEVLKQVYDALDARDRELFTHSLFVGVEMKDNQVEYRLGDFLIRHLLGVDPAKGMMVIAGEVRPYQVLQFHLRDARTAQEDLARMLQRHAATGPAPGGALLFACLGRGEHLFGCANHDSQLFRQVVGDVPLGGFFCSGEIGPVGGRTFLHGYTSAFALFSGRIKSPPE
ncbi:MAG: FIST C-terminal domain-containing protein [Myxococcota bacterium]|nr:FIST C-terminal domain-containing protein [Myxococcota bacterium]